MTRMLTVLMLIAGFSQAAVAQTQAVFSDGVLKIPGGAIVDDSSMSYFHDIRLERNGDGQFVVAGAKEAKLVHEIDSVDAVVSETVPDQVDVTVAGEKSTPCVNVMDPAIARDGTTFRIALGESEEQANGEVCTQVIQPFETSFSLDIEGLEAGTYTVNVNGVESDFTL